MRKEKALIDLLKGVVDLLVDEATRNPTFAEKLDALLEPLPEKVGTRLKVARPSAKDLPDVYKEWNSRGEAEFRLWLRDQPIPILRALIRAQDLDSTRRTTKWKEAEKLAGFIADSLRQRLSRGSSFIGRGTAD
jgi:hypothetical protein